MATKFLIIAMDSIKPEAQLKGKQLEQRKKECENVYAYISKIYQSAKFLVNIDTNWSNIENTRHGDVYYTQGTRFVPEIYKFFTKDDSVIICGAFRDVTCNIAQGALRAHGIKCDISMEGTVPPLK